MKKLFILRHAETEFPKGTGDHDRTLTNKGEEKAVMLGKVMKDNALYPDYAICSTATRTRQTLENVAHSLPAFEQDFQDDIYHASMEDLLSAVQNLPEERSAVLVVGHNPSIFGLAATLSEKGDLNLIKNLFKGYHPGSLTVIDADIKSWADLMPSKTRITDLLLPQNDYSKI